MTDTSTALEPGGFCSGCGTFVAVRLADIHKRRGCAARLDNTVRQYRQAHDGEHVTLEKTLDSFDSDIVAIIRRQDAAEAAASNNGQQGLTVTDDLTWNPDLDDELDDGQPSEPRHPLTDAQPRINPVTGLPE